MNTYRSAFGWIVVSAWLAGCSSSTNAADVTTDQADTAVNDARSDTGTMDSTTGDASNDAVAADAASDVPVADGSSDSQTADSSDGAAMGADGSVACTTDSDCVTYWCGCGSCDPSTIECFSVQPYCPPRGCAQSCPQLQTTGCACVAGMCVTANASSDGGSPDSGASDSGGVGDSAADGGGGADSSNGGGAGTLCTTSQDCAAGLACCYPCGQPGCQNVCTVVPDGGTCPRIL